MQGSAPLKRRPIASMLAWGMVYGILVDAALAYALHGPPVIETRIGYWLGLLYLGLIASAAAFTLYFRVIRELGPGKAAYSSLIIPVIAMAISTVAEDYHWSLLAAAGGVLALVGMLVALTAKKVVEEPPAA
jgi:drug/metabolite transporter (DMT)-like permease